MRTGGFVLSVALAFVLGAATNGNAGEDDVLRRGRVCAKLEKLAADARRKVPEDPATVFNPAVFDGAVYRNISAALCRD